MYVIGEDSHDGLLKLTPEDQRTVRSLLDFFPVGISIADAGGRLRVANRAAERLLGVDRDSHEARDIGSVEWRAVRRDGTPLPVDQWASVVALREKRLVENVEIGMVRPDGSIAWILASATPTDIPGFELAITYQDIGRLVENDAAVLESRRRVSDYLSHLPHPLLITDASGTVTELNAAFCEMYGYSREEVLGRKPSVLNPGRRVYEDLGVSEDEYLERFRSLWSSIQDPRKGYWRGELVNRKKNGALVPVQLEIRTIFGPDGRPSSYVGLPVDISVIRSREASNKIDLYRTIADLAALRDHETGNHMKRVGIFSKELAKSIGASAKYAADMEVFAPMHDIGKVGIPDAILSAGRKLEDFEFEHLKRHTVFGHDIVKGKPELELAAAITLRHHERWDGSGYPGGLAGEDIPLSARITAVADVYDALRSSRPYKEPWSHERAVEEIASGAGTHFDPLLVEKFLELAPSFGAISERLADG